MVGVDISFMDFAEDIIHHDLPPNSYMFLMERLTGKLLYHPMLLHHNSYSHKHQNKFSSLYDYYMQNSLTNAEHVELANDFLLVKNLIMVKSSSSHTVKLTIPLNANERYFNFWHVQHFIKNQYNTIKYYWRWIPSSSFVVIIAEYGSHQSTYNNSGYFQRNNYNFTLSGNVNMLVNHRLDFLENMHRSDIRLCKHFNQLATIGNCLLLNIYNFTN